MKRNPADPRIFAHLAYTTFFEKVVVVTTSSANLSYGTLTCAHDLVSLATFTLPTSANWQNPSNGIKDAFHLGVLNMEGTQSIDIVSPDGKNINGTPGPLVVSAEPGAFAIVFWVNAIDQWAAMVGCCGGGG